MQKNLIIILFLSFLLVPLSAQIITVSSPNGGEMWPMGSSKDITWEATDISRQLRITLWQNGELVGLIRKNVNSSPGLIQWTVGELEEGTAAPGSGFTIKIKEQRSIPEVVDFSDGPFSIIHSTSHSLLSSIQARNLCDFSVESITLTDEAGNVVGTNYNPGRELLLWKYDVKTRWNRHFPPGKDSHRRQGIMITIRNTRTHKRMGSLDEQGVSHTDGSLRTTLGNIPDGVLTIKADFKPATPEWDINPDNNSQTFTVTFGEQKIELVIYIRSFKKKRITVQELMVSHRELEFEFEFAFQNRGKAHHLVGVPLRWAIVSNADFNNFLYFARTWNFNPSGMTTVDLMSRTYRPDEFETIKIKKRVRKAFDVFDPGKYYLVVVIDYTRQLDDANYNNNCRKLAFWLEREDTGMIPKK